MENDLSINTRIFHYLSVIPLDAFVLVNGRPMHAEHVI